jgi:hypothetical protein
MLHADSDDYMPMSARVCGKEFFLGAVEGVHEVVDKGELALKDFWARCMLRLRAAWFCRKVRWMGGGHS